LSDSRFKITTSPAALPGSCFICNSSDRKYFIDVGLSMEFHGAVYICNECLSEMAEECDFLSPESAEKLKKQIDMLEKDVYALTKKEAGLERAVDGLVSAGYSRSDTPNSDSGGGTVTPLHNERTEVTENNMGSGEGTPPKQSNDERMAELPNDAGSNASEFSLNI